MTKEKVIDFNRKNVDTSASPKGYGFTYIAKKDFDIGQELMRGWGTIIAHQTPHISVQIGMDKHYLPEKWTGRYWNHSCDPNSYATTRPDGFPSLFALKKIKKGDEIHYYYAMTEYRWIKNADENRIACRCGAKRCDKKILSFSQLDQKKQHYLKKNKLCSKYLLMLK